MGEYQQMVSKWRSIAEDQDVIHQLEEVLTIVIREYHIKEEFCSHSETTKCGDLYLSPASSAQHLFCQLHLLSPHHPVGLLLPPLSDTHD